MRWKSWLIILGACLLIGFTACDTNETIPSDSGQVNPYERLRTAYDKVLASQSIYKSCFSIGSDDSYITVDTNPFDLDDYFNKNYINVVVEINEALNLPEYIYKEMLTTTALQGKQTETVNGITVTWSYHPDNGLEILYKLAN